MTDNPLLKTHGLPAFDDIRPEHVAPAVDTVLAENRTMLEEALTDCGDEPRWERLFGRLDVMDERLHRAWAPIAHLNAVRNTPEMREAYNACLDRVSDYSTEIAQNASLYRACELLAKRRRELDPVQRKILDDTLRDFRLAGVHLPGGKKKRAAELFQSLARLATRFEENVLDATHDWHETVADENELRGVPQDVKARLAAAASAEGDKGWRLGLDFPTYFAIMTHAESRKLRERMYHASVTRASETGPGAGKWDNSQVMVEILARRGELARLMGYANYAEYSLATKMAESPHEVADFLGQLVERVRPAAEREFRELEAFAREELGLGTLEAWDVGFASEKLRQQRFGLSEEAVRPYFPLNQVLNGLFEIACRVFGISASERHDISAWHEDVRFFELRDAEGELRGSLYTDFFARKGKRSGAWMDDAIGRWHRPEGLQHPVAYLVCNFPPPNELGHSLLSHDEVITLFHEFGHCMQHVLTQVDYPNAAGINGVPWDAVELPSQMNENFAWDRECLSYIGSHVESGEPLPDSVREQMLAARDFQSAMKLVRQLEFAIFDLEAHMGEFAEISDLRALLDDVRARVAVVPVPDYNRFAHGFSHIFGGGYAAGYYSYLWAEVLAADCWSAFEEAGVFNVETGRRYLQTVLEQGGSREALDIFRDFRGREPLLEPFLRQHGVTTTGGMDA
ncbi:MAG: M3 family metallopeptidase [Gammaproteobacteria bacterium]